MKVKFELPLAEPNGVTVAVQFGAVPDQATLAVGISATFDEVIDKKVLLQAKAVSTSEIVKLIAIGVD